MKLYNQPMPSGVFSPPRAYSAYSAVSCNWSKLIETGCSRMSSLRPSK
ncbi:Uncharacterised protein [Mycobacterium tuberculosis]|nr:Uncharacterised protein [Mycobacterium tuberculosis]